MKALGGLITASAGLLLLATACSESGEGGRRVDITQKDDGCTPTSVAVTAGEKLQFVVKNDSSSDVYEVEGIDGTKLEEFVVPSGRTRKSGYTVPEGEGTYKLKCYVPTGASTIIELVAGAGGRASGTDGTRDATDAGISGPADDSVRVGLSEYKVTTDKASVRAGKISFEYRNESAGMVHELAVLRRQRGATIENIGEVEDIEPGADAAVIFKLDAGEYELACLIAPGESGSTVNHYAQGMHTAFTVTE